MPCSSSSTTVVGFATTLPPLRGSYRMYADVVHPGTRPTLLLHRRDSTGGPYNQWTLTIPGAERPSSSDTARLPDGSTMEWRKSAFVAASSIIAIYVKR
jgi:hypothetical protein